MASFTVFVAGDSSDALEMRERVAEVGVALGYGARRGLNRGRGAPGLMLRDIAEGKAAVLPAGREDDWEWLAGVLEQLIPGNPDRLELLRSGVEACKAAQDMRERGPVGGVDRGGRFEPTEGADAGGGA